MKYPKSYHEACNHLIFHGAHNHAARGRAIVARALRDLRKQFGSEVARREAYHMRFISGQLPVKG
jgi:hypothetical protein